MGMYDTVYIEGYAFQTKDLLNDFLVFGLSEDNKILTKERSGKEYKVKNFLKYKGISSIDLIENISEQGKTRFVVYGCLTKKGISWSFKDYENDKGLIDTDGATIFKMLREANKKRMCCQCENMIGHGDDQHCSVYNYDTYGGRLCNGCKGFREKNPDSENYED